MIAAIEVFNKPGFQYREETFSLLALNAWELLLKGRVIALNGNKVNAIRVYEPKINKTTGKPSKKLYLKRNRTGNPMTISPARAISILDGTAATKLSAAVKANIDALLAIRDNAAHYFSASPALAKHTLEIGTASVSNFIHAAKAWFSRDFSRDLSLLLPIGFVNATQGTGLTTGPDERNLIEYLRGLADSNGGSDENGSPFAVAITVNINMSRSKLDSAAKVEVVKNDPSAAKVQLTYDDMQNMFPWDYKTVLAKLKAKHPELKQDKSFHAFMNKVKDDSSICLVRYLDPANKSGLKKGYYSPNIVDRYLKHIGKA